MDKKMASNLSSALREFGVTPGHEIASGSYGTVFAVKNYRGRRNLCIKIFTDIRDKDAVSAEYQVGRRLYEMNPDYFGEYLSLMFFSVPDPQFPRNRLCCAGILQERLEPIDKQNRDPEVMIRILTDINTCLYYLQKMYKGHFDIKTSNIMLNRRSGHYCLIDFGLSYTLDMLKTCADPIARGTRYTMPPEMIENRWDAKISITADYYALGMTLRYLMSGCRDELSISACCNQKELFEAKKALAPLSYGAEYPDGLIDIVNRATAFDRRRRYRNANDLFEDIVVKLGSRHLPKGVDSQLLETMRNTDPIRRLLLICMETSAETARYLDEVTKTVNRVTSRLNADDTFALELCYSDKLYILDGTPRPLCSLAPVKLRAFSHCNLGKAVQSAISVSEDLEENFGYRPEIHIVFIGTGHSRLPPLASSLCRTSFTESEREAARVVGGFRGIISGICFSSEAFGSVGFEGTPVRSVSALERELTKVLCKRRIAV